MARQVSPQQLEMLLYFMEQHHSLALGRVRGKEGSAMSKKLWGQCAKILNSNSSGLQKSPEEWKKYYNQYKSRTKAKYRTIKQGLMKTSSGPANDIIMSPLEERLISIVGGCDSPPPVRQNSLDDSAFDGAPQEDNDPMELHLNKNKISSFPSANQPNVDAKAELFVVPDENLEVVVDEEDMSTCNVRETKEKPPMRSSHLRSSSPKMNSELPSTGQRLTANEQSRIDVDRGLIEAIHRHASAMEDIAGAVNRFVDSYIGSRQQSGRHKRRRTISIFTSSSSSSSD